MKKSLSLFIFTGLVLFSFYCRAQMPDGRWILPAQIQNGDTIPQIRLSTVEVSVLGIPGGKDGLAAYLKLKYNVRLTLPYAKRAAKELNDINTKSATFKNHREKKKYLKAEELILREQFEDQLKNLTVTQGRVLLKLIDRETGTTTFALVKELKGTFHAVFWQGIARWWGSNLKDGYDADGEDKMIEQIIKELEAEENQKNQK